MYTTNDIVLREVSYEILTKLIPCKPATSSGMSVLMWSISRAFNNWLLSKNWFSWKIGLIQITDAIFASKEQCYFTRFFIYDLLPCNHTKIYIIFLDINLLKYRTPCSAAEAESTREKFQTSCIWELQQAFSSNSFDMSQITHSC